MYETYSYSWTYLPNTVNGEINAMRQRQRQRQHLRQLEVPFFSWPTKQGSNVNPSGERQEEWGEKKLGVVERSRNELRQGKTSLSLGN